MKEGSKISLHTLLSHVAAGHGGCHHDLLNAPVVYWHFTTLSDLPRSFNHHRDYFVPVNWTGETESYGAQVL